MKKKGENWSAKELRRYVVYNFPFGTIAKTNKPYDKGAAIIFPDGRVYAKDSSNFHLVQQLTEPESDAAREANAGIRPLLDIPQTYDLKTYPEKKMAEALSHIIEAQEFSGEEKVEIIRDGEGMAVRIKTEASTYNLYGREKS